MARNFLPLWMAVVAVQLVPAAFADQEQPVAEGASRAPAASEPRDNSDEEYNFSWLDPDKKVYVLQNRKYRKAHRLGAFVQGGLNLSNPYRTDYFASPRLAYWFSEQFGLEAFGAFHTNSDNSTLKALKNASPTALPFVREMRSYYAAVFTYTPWYAKLNFFNKILYFDWFFNAGVGQVNTALDTNIRADRTPNFKTENLMAFYFGTGQDFYVTRNFLVRMDLIGMMYSATGADNKTKGNTTNFDFAAGIGYLF